MSAFIPDTLASLDTKSDPIICQISPYIAFQSGFGSIATQMFYFNLNFLGNLYVQILHDHLWSRKGSVSDSHLGHAPQDKVLLE